MSELCSSRNPRKWRFTWEAQSHVSTLRLFLFNPIVKPSTQCKGLRVDLRIEQSVLLVSWFHEEEENGGGGGGGEILLRVPIPRVLVDAESPVHHNASDDHIEVKLALLLPVDHPILTDFEDESHLQGAFLDELKPLSMDSELPSLSSAGEVTFYCRNCSAELTKSLSCFVELPSVNWREVADNWFGSCCCSFGGISEKLVTRYANAYTCAAGTCLLNTTSITVCKDDLVGCDFPDCNGNRKKFDTEVDLNVDYDLTKDVLNNVSVFTRDVCCENHTEAIPDSDVNLHCVLPGRDNLAGVVECKVSDNIVNAERLLSVLTALNISEDVVSAPNCCIEANNHVLKCEIEDWSLKNLETSAKAQNHTPIELLVNHKSFLNGYLGNPFMVGSSNLSKDVEWTEFLCPQCLCVIGAYPCGNSHALCHEGVRLFKCCISTCLPVGGLNDLFRKYTLVKMFSNQLLESANNELSYRVVVKDLSTRSPMLKIVIVNPNSWCYTGYCLDIKNEREPALKIHLYPWVRVLFSDCSSSTESQLRVVEEWISKNEADEVFMFTTQIKGLIDSLKSAKDMFPPSFTFLQGLSLSSMQR